MRKWAFLLAAIICLLTVSACAEGLYFINPEGGTRLHADPFCPTASDKYLPLTPVPEGAGEYEPCNLCWIQFAIPEATEIPAPAEETVWYYNPDGGTKRHVDPNCPSSHEKYLPFKGTVTPSDPLFEQLGICSVCTTAEDQTAGGHVIAPAGTIWYYNPDGGVYRHADPNCATIHSRYLPLTASFKDGDEAFAHLKDCTFCSYEITEDTAYQDCLYMKSLAIKAASQPGVWGMPEDTHVHADVAEETAVIALKQDYQIDQLTDGKTVTATFFYPKGASGHDRAHYRICVMEIGGLETLENWRLLYYATVDAETGKINTYKVVE